MAPTEEQQAIIDHDPTRCARILAGPGTGKSFTAVALLQKLSAPESGLACQMVTFTRAATGELVKKLASEGKTGMLTKEPSTIHSFALSILNTAIRAGHRVDLPTPIRILDSWENKLVQSHIAKLLRAAGFNEVRSTEIQDLENAMSCQWQALQADDPRIKKLDAKLRNAYVGIWAEHRVRFGYTLHAELPYRAAETLEERGELGYKLDLLIVDEYQDLNKADIRLMEQVRFVANAPIIAIGDDDQSLYGFRFAAREGIRTFEDDFNAICYDLTFSRRCGADILAAATALIETEPTRPPGRKRLTPPTAPGTFAHLRFKNEKEELKQVARLIKHQVDNGVAAPDIAVLVRSGADSSARDLKVELDRFGIDIFSTDLVKNLLEDEKVRYLIAISRLAENRLDSVAWWTLMTLTKGIGEVVLDSLYAEAGAGTVGALIVGLHESGFAARTGSSWKVMARLVSETLLKVDGLNLTGVVLGEEGWAEWFIEQLEGHELPEGGEPLIREVGKRNMAQPQSGESARPALSSFIASIEPIGKDVMMETTRGVRVMTMLKSKGLTFHTAILMGIDSNTVPDYREDRNQEIRLLYVGMTRATDVCLVTWAAKRNGPSARRGVANPGQSRARTPLFNSLPMAAIKDGQMYVGGFVG